LMEYLDANKTGPVDEEALRAEADADRGSPAEA
jgi:hypothetical protein